MLNDNFCNMKMVKLFAQLLGVLSALVLYLVLRFFQLVAVTWLVYQVGKHLLGVWQ